MQVVDSIQAVLALPFLSLVPFSYKALSTAFLPKLSNDPLVLTVTVPLAEIIAAPGKAFFALLLNDVVDSRIGEVVP